MKQATTQATIGHVEFAIRLGFADRLTREASEPFRKAYASMDATQQKTFREEWIVGYLQGNLQVSATHAAKIAAQSREDRSKAHQQAYDRARAQFKYHCLTATTKVAFEKDAVLALLNAFDRLTAAEQRKAFKAISKAMAE